MNVDKLTYPGLIVNKFEVGRIMPKADQLWDEWHDIDWKRVESYVWKLQKQIYRASIAGESVMVHTLQKRLLRSYFAKLLAVRKVSQENQGKRTAGVDGVKALTPNARFQLANRLSIKRQPRPIRRVYIPKPGKTEKRPLGMPIWAAHYPSFQAIFGIPWAILLVDRSYRSTVIIILYHTLINSSSASLLPLPPDWLAQRCDDLRGEGNPAWSQRGGTNTLQDASLAPVRDGRDVDIEQVCRGTSRVAAISPLPSWCGFRALGASSRDVIGITNPLDFTDRKRASHASSLSFLIEQGGHLRIRLRRRPLPHALDHLWAGLAFFPRHLVPWDSKTREGLGLPTNGDIDDVASLRERHILDQPAQQLLALNERGRWRMPERWQVMSKLANLLALRGAKQKRRRFGQQGVLSLQLFHLRQLLIPLPFQ